MADSNFWDLSNIESSQKQNNDFWDLSDVSVKKKPNMLKSVGNTVLNVGKSFLSGGSSLFGGAAEFTDTMAGNFDDTDSFNRHFKEKYPKLAKADINPTKYADYDGGFENISTVFNNAAEKLRPEDKESIVDAYQRGDYISLAKNILYSVGETVPQLLGIIAATAAGSPQVGLGMVGATAAGNKHSELEDNPDVSSFKAKTVSALNGLFEITLESFGTGKIAKNIVGELGEEAVERLAKEATLKIIAKAGGKESLEEFFTGIAEGTTDKLTGIENYSWQDILKMGVEQGIPAFFTGGTMGTIQATQNIKARKAIEQQNEQFKQGIKQNVEGLNETNIQTPAEDFYNLEEVQKPIDTSKLEKAIPGLKEFFGVEVNEDVNNTATGNENIDLAGNAIDVERKKDMNVRDLDNVGSRKVYAYQYENPEVKPFYQEMANQLLGDLKAGTKGERVAIVDPENSRNVQDWTGTKRFMSETIKNIKDETGATYADIEDSLNRIIEDKGQENQALAKRIELILDDKLINGYEAWGGYDIPPNQDYMQVKQQIEKNDNKLITLQTEQMGQNTDAKKNTELHNEEIKALQKGDTYEEYNLNQDVDITSFVKDAFTGKRDKFKKINFGKVNTNEAKKIKELTGKEVEGFNHVISNDDINHILKKHGNPESEKLRGQIAVTLDDFKELPDVIKNYDSIEKGDDGPQGEKSVKYKKRINGHAIVVEVVSKRRKAMRIKTMWKVPTTTTDSEVLSARSYVRNGSGLTPSINNIPLNEENSKYENSEIPKHALPQQLNIIEGSNVEPVSRKEIDEFIFNEVIPISQGRLMNRSAEGEYNTREETVKIKKDSDLMTKAHELGHHLIRTLGVENPKQIPSNALSEVISVFNESNLNKNAYNESQYWDEGNSEFWKLYLSDAKKAQQVAPNYYEFLESRVKNSPIEDKVRTLQDYYNRWVYQPAEEQVRGSIARKEIEAKDFMSPMDKLMMIWLDDKRPYEKIRNVASEKLGKKPINFTDILKNNPNATLADARKQGITMFDDPYRQARKLDAAVDPIIQSLVMDNQINSNYEVVGPGLKQILEPISDYLGTREKIGDFETWIVALHGLERQTKGKTTGIPTDVLKKTIERLEKPGFRDAAEQLQGFHKNLLDWQVDKGLISAEAKETISNAYEWYMPLNRLIGSQGYGSVGGDRLVDLPAVVKRAYGSNRIIKSPLETLIHNTSTVIKSGLKNEVMSSLYNLSREAGGMGRVIETVATPLEVKEIALKTIKSDLLEAGVPQDVIDEMDLDNIAKSYEARFYANQKDNSENVHTVRIDGEARFVKINSPDLNKAINNFDKSVDPTSFIGKLFTLPSKMVKTGAVTAPYFILKNPIRDQKTSLWMADETFVPIVETLKGLKALRKGGETELTWRAAGGSRGGFADYMLDFMSNGDATISDIIKNTEEYNAIQNIFNFTANAWDKYTKIPEASEESTRLGHYTHLLEKYNIENKSPLEKRLIYEELAEKSRADVNLDYLRKGTAVRQIDQYMAFTGPAINNLYTVFEKLRKNPIKYTLRGLMIYTIPALIRYAINKDKPEYEEMPLWQRISYNNYQMKNGKWVTLPIAFTDELIFGKVPELMLEAMDKGAPDDVNKIVGQFAQTGITYGYPNFITPFVGLWKNEKPFTGSPVIPYDQLDIEPVEQYGTYTYELPKILASVFNKIPGSPDTLKSPRKLQLFIKQYGATLGKNAMSLTDFVTGKKNSVETMSEIFPIVREPYISALSIDRVYEKQMEAERIVNTYRKQLTERRGTNRTPDISNKEYGQALSEIARYKSATSFFSSMSKVRDMIRNNNNYTEEKKGKEIDKINKEMINRAREVLGKEPIDFNN